MQDCNGTVIKLDKDTSRFTFWNLVLTVVNTGIWSGTVVNGADMAEVEAGAMCLSGHRGKGAILNVAELR